MAKGSALVNEPRQRREEVVGDGELTVGFLDMMGEEFGDELKLRIIANAYKRNETVGEAARRIVERG